MIDFQTTDYPEEFWLRLLPDEDYRPRMQLRPGDAAAFWAKSASSALVLSERRRWLSGFPDRHLLFMDQASVPLGEFLRWLHTTIGVDFGDAVTAAGGMEPDWLLLENDATGGFPLLGGALIFPSGWSLEERLGQSLPTLHAPVPGLQHAMGSRISAFLARLQPGQPWQRDNWGISVDPALNHHPAIPRHRPAPTSRLDELWVRLEEQFLMLLPSGSGIVFAIRVSTHRLDLLLAAYPRLTPRVARALASMPDGMARYKGLIEANPSLLQKLAALP